MTTTLNMIAGYLKQEWNETHIAGEINRSMIWPFSVNPTTVSEICYRHFIMHHYRESVLHTGKVDTHILIN